MLSAFCFFFPRISFSQEIKPLPEFTSRDRVLVLAPHPDDETLGTGGVIQKAVKAGAKIKVVCFTNGDHNEFAFIVYEKRITFRRKEFVHMGEVRKKETISAMKFLGLAEDDLVFLGYPDFGTAEILTKYWGKTKPFKDLLTRLSCVPYPECLSYKAPYVGESILKDMEAVLFDFKPTKVFVSDPVDVNRDHRSLYVFLHIALWDLEKKIHKPEIFSYLIHVVGWPKPRGFHPGAKLMPPEKLKNSHVYWYEADLPGGEIIKKKQAVLLYKSQTQSAAGYLFTFVRKNELFGDYPVVRLERQRDKEEIKWRETDFSSESLGETAQNGQVSELSYALAGKDFFIKVKSKNDKHFKGSIFLLGYSKKTPFSRMPKIRLGVGVAGLEIKDKKTTLFVKDAGLTHEGNTVTLKIPLSLLGNPDRIFSCIRTRPFEVDLEDTAWRIIEF